MKKRRIRIKPKFWVFLAMFVIACISLTGNSENVVKTEKMTYVVRAGDTLWDIAEKYAPKNMDIREYIYNVEKHNGLDSMYIHPDMELEIERVIE